MTQISNENLEKLASLQDQIWQIASTSVSEASNQLVSFETPLTVAARTADLYAEMSVPMMVISFAFAVLPDNPTVILIPQDTITSLFELVQGTTVDEIDENIVADLRAPLEAIVQGLCLAVGNIRNDMVVASGLSIRYQIFSFPPNLQRHDKVVRTQVAVAGDEVSGSMIWLADTETAHYLIGEEVIDDENSPFMRIGPDGQPSNNPAPRAGSEDGNHLDLLLDVPLEISVELGRVKMLVKDVLELGNGSILEIDKSAGEPVDVLVNGRLMARGEVVVIEDNFGVRITEIINPHERMTRTSEAA